MLNNLDLNQLKVFLQVYRLLGVRGASRAMGITPSAVSQAIQKLEVQTGHRLFQRIAKRMLPTPAADSLFVIAQKFTKEMENYLGGKSSRSSLVGHLTIGAPPEFGSRQVVQVLSKFKNANAVNFSIHFDLPDRLMAFLAAGKLDVAFCDYGPYLKHYERTALWKTVFYEGASLVCSREFYSKFVREDHSLAHLSNLPHVDYREDGGVLSLWYRHHFKKIPKQIPLKLVASNVNAIITGVTQGLGLGFIPTHLIKDMSNLVEIKTKKSQYQNPIVLVQLKDKVPTLLEKQFVSYWGI